MVKPIYFSLITLLFSLSAEATVSLKCSAFFDLLLEIKTKPKDQCANLKEVLASIKVPPVDCQYYEAREAEASLRETIGKIQGKKDYEITLDQKLSSMAGEIAPKISKSLSTFCSTPDPTPTPFPKKH